VPPAMPLFPLAWIIMKAIILPFVIDDTQTEGAPSGPDRAFIVLLSANTT
jgi:hypothetical protein